MNILNDVAGCGLPLACSTVPHRSRASGGGVRVALALAALHGASCGTPTASDAAVGADSGFEAGDGGIAVDSGRAARGLFVPVSLTATGMNDARTALALADIDGIAVDIVWTDIAGTSPMTYDFTALGAMLQLAASAGKSVELAVVAGGGTPSWFGASPILHLVYTPHNGATGNCYVTDTPALWDPAYLAAWDDMTAQLATYLATSGLMNTVVALRLTGLNASTAETHLPAQQMSDLTRVPSCFGATDNVMAWHVAGYTPTKMHTAWMSMINSWATHFPSVLFEFIEWGAEGIRFPPIDDTGIVMTPPSMAFDQSQYDTVVSEAAGLLGSRLIVGRWYLMTGTPADSTTVGYANTYGLGTTWQTNLWWTAFSHGSVPGAAACGGTLAAPLQCTDATFLQELQTGLMPQRLTVPQPQGATRILEVFMPDPMLYPTATHAAHLALTQ